LALFLCAVLADRETRWRSEVSGLVLLFMLSFGYGYGVVCELDTLLDRSPDDGVQTTVLRKTKYRRVAGLDVAPWDAVRGIQHAAVPNSVFNAVELGGPVCIAQRAGALGVAWYTAQACPWRGGPVALEPDDVFP